MPGLDIGKLSLQVGTLFEKSQKENSSSSTKYSDLEVALREQFELKTARITVKAVSGIGDVGNRLGELYVKSPHVGCVILVADESTRKTFEEKAPTFVGRGRNVQSLVGFVQRGKKCIPEYLLGSPEDGLLQKLRTLLPDARFMAPTMPEPLALPAEKLDVASLLSETAALALSKRVSIDVSWVRQVASALEERKSIVLYGPPGTGKTFVARELAAAIQPNPQSRVTVQFHPSYGYEEFFEGYRPALVDGAMTLAIQHGPLRKMADVARGNPSEPVVLVIDEINRGNLPRIFGELYFLLEYRDDAAALMYSPNERFSLPKNLFIIGSMNTADRSVVLLDQALRRRFSFFSMFPSEAPVSEMLRRFLASQPEMDWVAAFLDLINKRLGDRNVAIGPSHFMRRDLNESVLRRIWEQSILPTLEDHYFGDPEPLRTDFVFEQLVALAKKSES